MRGLDQPQKYIPSGQTRAAEAKQYIFDHLEKRGSEQSERNLRKLMYDMLRPKPEFVSFVGAGASRALGIPDWGELINGMLEECGGTLRGKYPLPHKYSTKEARLAAFTEKHERFFPDIAQEVRDELQPEEYCRFIRQSMERRKEGCTAKHILLARLIRTHLTTNFDKAMVDAYATQGSMHDPLLRYLRDLTDFTRSDVPRIYFLHADPEEDIYILARDDYETWYKGSQVEVVRCIETFFLRNSILFIGFSFADQYVRDCLFTAYESAQQSKGATDAVYGRYGKRGGKAGPNHYLLIDGSRIPDNERAIDEYFTEYESHSIRPIVYKEGHHIFVDKFLLWAVEEQKHTFEAAEGRGDTNA